MAQCAPILWSSPHLLQHGVGERFGIFGGDERAGRAQAKLFDIEDACMPDSALATAISP